MIEFILPLCNTHSTLFFFFFFTFKKSTILDFFFLIKMLLEMTSGQSISETLTTQNNKKIQIP